MSASEPTIDALISLLEDQDEVVFQSVKSKMLSLGPQLIPKLEDAMLLVDTADHARRLEEIIAQLKKTLLTDQLQTWLNDENRSLLDGWLLVSSVHHPNISKEKMENSIQKLCKETWMEVNESMTSLEKVAVINHILFRINQFEISGSDMPTVENIVLDKLLFSKTGDAHSLTILYLLIARSLHLDLLPITLANKILLVYEDNLAASLAFGASSDKFLFYINVAHQGSIISPKEIQFLYEKSQKYGKVITRTETDITLIKRLLNIMYLVYTNEAEEEKLSITEKLLGLLEGY